ncbi:MAG: hypothetical protein WA102_01305 [Candidatus Methanoperedens sp.]
MNWKNITIIVSAGYGWMFFVSYFIAPSFYELGFIIVTINAIATCFIGSIIAGRLSTADAWKNGLYVGIFLFTVVSIFSFLLIILGLVDLSVFELYGLYNLTDVIGETIISLMIYATTGTIGGFIGGKIRRE